MEHACFVAPSSKDVLERYLLVSDFATLENIQKIPQLNVHGWCIISMSKDNCIISHGVADVVPILYVGNAKAGDKDRLSVIHVFFCPMVQEIITF